MKKILLIVTLVVAALAALSVGVVAAQEGNPPYGKRGVADGTGYLHEYMEKVMAEVLGLSVSEFEARNDEGNTFYQIALEKGFSAEEIPALMQAARAEALDAAEKDGVISQEQAQWMNSRGFGRGGMHGGFGNGDCPMYGYGQGTGAGYDRGRMRGWGGQYNK